MKRKVINKISSILFMLGLLLFIVSLSISIPILFRPFYFWLIKPLGIQESSGYDLETIKDAYNDLLNFCTFGSEFKVGSLNYTEEGKQHFVDVVYLFHIDFALLAISFLVVFTIALLYAFKRVDLEHYFSLPCYFYSGVFSLILFFGIVLTIGLDFNNSFTRFHQLFFSDKADWHLDLDKDQIINILPSSFFLACALLIGILIIVFSFIIIIVGIKNRKKVVIISK